MVLFLCLCAKLLARQRACAVPCEQCSIITSCSQVHEDADAVIEMMSAEDAPAMEAYVVYTDEAIASAADGGYGIAFLPRGAIKVFSQP